MEVVTMNEIITVETLTTIGAMLIGQGEAILLLASFFPEYGDKDKTLQALNEASAEASKKSGLGFMLEIRRQPK
jgi:hypothetical protein